MNSTNNPKQVITGKWISILLGWPWLEIIGDVWQTTRRIWQGFAHEGLYEVAEHSVTLELLDVKGKRAQITKQQKVRYLQDNVIAYQDQAWGDGNILLKYRCSPGVEVDRYKSGHKTHLLISLRQVKNRGDVDTFRMQWQQRNGFGRKVEEWGSEINHKTKQLQLQVIFPKKRPPQKVDVVQQLANKTTPLPSENVRKLPDGKWTAVWSTTEPHLNERYLLQWSW